MTFLLSALSRINQSHQLNWETKLSQWSRGSPLPWAWGWGTTTTTPRLPPAGKVKPWVGHSTGEWIPARSTHNQAKKRGMGEKGKRNRNPPGETLGLGVGWGGGGEGGGPTKKNRTVCSALHLFCVRPRRCIRPCPHLHSGVFGLSLADAVSPATHP